MQDNLGSSIDYPQLRTYYNNNEWTLLLEATKSLDIESLSSGVLELIGGSQAALGMLEQAEKTFRLLKQKEPKSAIHPYNLAKVLIEQERQEDAIQELKHAIQTNPEDEDLLVLLGDLFTMRENLDGAIKTYQQGVDKLPNSKNIRWRLSQSLHSASRHEEAFDSYINLINLHDDDFRVFQDAAVCATEMEEYAKAKALFEKSLAISPLEDHTRFNYSKLLVHMGHYAQARVIVENLLSQATLAVPISEAALDLSIILHRMGLVFESGSMADRGLRESPDHKMLKLQKATTAISVATDKASWNEYGIRHTTAREVPSPIDLRLCPEWQGQNLSEKALILWFEQAYGDMLVFFCSLPFIATVAKRVLAVVPHRLLALARQNYPQVQFVGFRNAEAPNVYEVLAGGSFDYQGPIGDFWSPFWEEQASEVTFKAIRIPERLVSEFGKITENISGFRVGISWYSGRDGKRQNPGLTDKNRYSLSVSDLEILASVKPVQWFNLQYGDYVREVARVEDFTDCFHSFSDYSANGDFLEYGAQILNVDLVVSMDSTAAVFAACMGKEVWVLCPNDPSWFWMVNEQKNYCSNVSLFIKPWNLPWADFLTLEVVPRLQQRVSEFTNG